MTRKYSPETDILATHTEAKPKQNPGHVIGAIALMLAGILLVVFVQTVATPETQSLTIEAVGHSRGGVAIIAAKRTRSETGLPTQELVVIRDSRGDMTTYTCATEEAKMLCALPVGTDLRRLGEEDNSKLQEVTNVQAK